MAFDDTKNVEIKVAVDLKDFEKLQKEILVLENRLKQLNSSNKITSKTFNDVNGVLKGVTVTAQDVSGNITQISSKLKNIGGKEQTVAVTKELGKMNTEVKKGTSFTGELVKTLKHAAVVAPIWMAVRGAIQQVSATAKAGAEEVTKLDYALRRAAVVAGQGGLQWAQTDLASAAAQTQSKYGVAGSEFATVSEKLLTAGIGREESIAGTRAALEATIMTGEDAVKTAELLAVTYNTLGKTITGTTKEADKFNKITGIMSVLNDTNRISMKDYTAALMGSSTELANANVKFEDAAAIIATLSQAGQSGERIATSLRQLFTALAKSPQTLEKQFGVTIDSTRNYTQQLLDLLDAVGKKEAELEGSGTDILRAYSIFDVRSSKSFTSLNEFMTQLKANLQLVGKSADEIEKIRSGKLETMTDSLKVAFAKLDIAKAEVGKGFIFGLLGINDITDIDKATSAINNLTTALEGFKAVATASGLLLSAIPNAVNSFSKIAPPTKVSQDISKASPLIPIFNYLNKMQSGGKNLINPDKTTKYKSQAYGDLNAYNVGSSIYGSLDGGIPNYADISNLKVRLELSKKITEKNQESNKISESNGETQEKQSTKAKELYNWYDLIVKTRAHEAELINLGNTYGKDSITIEKERLALMIQQGANSENIKDIEAQRVKIAQLYVAEMNKYSQGLSNEIKTNLSSLLQGESSGKDFMGNISKYYKQQQSDVIAGGLTDMLMSTGIGEAFGMNMMELADSFKSPMERHVSDMQRILDDNIKQQWELLAAKAEVDGKTLEQMQGVGTGKSNTGIAGAVVNGVGALGGLFGKKDSTKVNTYQGSVTADGGYGSADFDENGNIVYNDGLDNAMAAKSTGTSIKSATQSKFDAGKWANRAMAAYSFGSWVGQSHKYKGTGNVWGGAGDGAVAGLSAGSSFGGYGALIGAVVGGVVGGVQGSKSKKNDDYDSQTGIIASKIDVSNKLMSITNRELAAIRQEFKTYLMPESSYFAQKANIEDQYAVNLRQGLR
jgi:TP901 family phage tail tape measure protein